MKTVWQEQTEESFVKLSLRVSVFGCCLCRLLIAMLLLTLKLLVLLLLVLLLGIYFVLLWLWLLMWFLLLLLYHPYAVYYDDDCTGTNKSIICKIVFESK
jgi:hypothetical protein